MISIRKSSSEWGRTLYAVRSPRLGFGSNSLRVTALVTGGLTTYRGALSPECLNEKLSMNRLEQNKPDKKTPKTIWFWAYTSIGVNKKEKAA
ncbi:hypothetical protein FXE91_11085 [Vibrio cholerae]|nr:hypothetical protein DLR67_06170 [Vibrio paracholerae]TXY57695.1 hypothetical protein FXE91_11085 [Vibrio cholerae]